MKGLLYQKPMFEIDVIYDNSIISLVDKYVNHVIQEDNLISLCRWLGTNEEWKKQFEVGNEYTLIISVLDKKIMTKGNQLIKRAEVFDNCLLVDYRPFDKYYVNKERVLAEKLIFERITKMNDKDKKEGCGGDCDGCGGKKK